MPESASQMAPVLRALPQVQKLLETPEARALAADFPRTALVRAVRGRLDQLRRRVLSGELTLDAFPHRAFFGEVRVQLETERRRHLRRTINATGIVIHTNLGRAPLATDAIEAVAEVASGYSNLEFDLERGVRGSRYAAVTDLLCELTGAEAALAVNNNAAAVLLALGAQAGGGEVLVSRAELVEIGGSFRIPDVIAQSGARLVEVGTTNRTRLSDYERAITPATRVLLKVHQSNYRIVGFTGAPELRDMVALGHDRGLVVMEDLGSGTLVDLRSLGLAHEPTVRDSIAAGVDLVTFSGDKLLGGPQAGIIVGRAPLIRALKSHPLLRAVRIDKLNLAALEATLRLHRDPERAVAAVPVLAMLAQPLDILARRAEHLAGLLAEAGMPDIRLEEGVGFAGGGSLPEVSMPTRLVTVRPDGMGLEELARRLRQHRPAVVGRTAAHRYVLDMRTVTDGDVADIAAAFRAVLA